MATPVPDAAKSNEIREKMIQYYDYELKGWDNIKVLGHEEVEQDVLPQTRQALTDVHPDVLKGYLGCGDISPGALEGLTVIDLGSGNGRDSFALSKQVGENGRVTGLDLSPEEVKFASSYRDYHRSKFGFARSNVEFKNGSIEDLKQFGIADKSIDVVYSNGVICLVPDRPAVYKEAYRVLKDGGEFIFFDVYASGRVDFDEAHLDKVVWGEGLGGAYYKDTLNELIKNGFTQPRFVSKVKAFITNPEVKAKLGDIQYAFVLYRAFKLPSGASKEAARARYNGGIPGAPDKFRFDEFTTFQTGQDVAVDAELSAILKNSRFSQFFTFSPLQSADKPQAAGPVVNPFEL